MNASRFSALALLVSAIALPVGQAGAQEGQTPEMQKMMETYAKYATPGEHHQLLDPLVGNWEATTSWRMEPDAEPQTSQATSECMWILGGRYLQENVTGEMDGNVFHGIGITGYDNFRGKYFSFWIDEMATSYMVSEGTVDETGKVFTMKGTYDDIMTGQKGKEFRTVSRIIDNDTHLYEMYEYDDNGNERRSFEVKYTRAAE
jgi:hypothetical protein